MLRPYKKGISRKIRWLYNKKAVAEMQYRRPETETRQEGCRMYRVETMDLAQAQAIAAWRYPAPYDVYNFPAWETMEATKWAITIPEKRAEEFRVVKEDTRVVGYFRLFAAQPRRKRFLSLGLLPALCGMGKGPGIMEQILAYAEKAGETALYMEVRSFNQRAIRCYQKVGFVAVDQYDKTILGSSYRILQMQYHF